VAGGTELRNLESYVHQKRQSHIETGLPCSLRKPLSRCPHDLPEDQVLGFNNDLEVAVVD
jgi:hypothetical protein